MSSSDTASTDSYHDVMTGESHETHIEMSIMCREIITSTVTMDAEDVISRVISMLQMYVENRDNTRELIVLLDESMSTTMIYDAVNHLLPNHSVIRPGGDIADEIENTDFLFMDDCIITGTALANAVSPLILSVLEDCTLTVIVVVKASDVNCHDKFIDLGVDDVTVIHDEIIEPLSVITDVSDHFSIECGKYPLIMSYKDPSDFSSLYHLCLSYD